MMHAAAPPPWYKQFWPWFLIALPASAVVAGIATLMIASHEPDGIVVDDYYKQGLAINQDLDRDRMAASLGLSAQVRLRADGVLQVVLQGDRTARLAVLQVSLLHPTKAGQDRVLTAKRMPDAHFEVALGRLETANWHVAIEPVDRSWRLHGRLQWPQTDSVSIRAQP